MLLSLFVKGQVLMRNKLMNGNWVEGDESGTREALDAFFKSNVLDWIMWGITFFFVIQLIIAGAKIANAKSPEEKQAAKSKIVGIGIGLAIVFSASVLVTTLKGMIIDVWGN